MVNLSTSFLWGLLDINTTEFTSKLKSVYCGNAEYEGSNNWGDYLYFVMDSGLTEELLNKLRNHPNYVKEQDPTKDSIMFIFATTSQQKMKVVYPFLEGKYSQVDREYVNKFFSRNTPTGSLSTNWRILHKDEGLKRIWEDRIGVKLAEDAEVWSKPVKKAEVFGYIEEEVLDSVSLV